MKEKNNIDRFDIETLACTIMGFDIDEMEYEEGKVEELFYEYFGFDLDIFEKIISKLIPLIDFGKSPLTGKKYKGFANIKEKFWILKTEC